MSREIEFQTKFGERLKQVRLAAGLSQPDFAKRVGSSQPTVSRVEAGTRMPDALLVKRVAAEFGCSIVWLLTGEGAP